MRRDGDITVVWLFGTRAVLSENPVYRFIAVRGMSFFFAGCVWLEVGAMGTSYEGPDSLDGGVALFFRLKVAACQKKKKKGCVLCARGYVRGAWEDKITLCRVQVAGCHWQ